MNMAVRPERIRVLDGLRAMAIFGVVCGHWLTGALVLNGGDGALGIHSSLSTLPWLRPSSWFFQMLGLFFLVGGYASAQSLHRSRHRDAPYTHWLRARFTRLTRPVFAAAAVVAAAISFATAAGVPPGTLRGWVLLFLQPLWFIGIYLIVTALTPALMALDRRFGARAALGFAAAVAVVDLTRYGPWGDGIPEWFGYLTVLPAWIFTYQLGIAWAHGRLDRRHAIALLAGGAALFALLIGALDYPWSIVSVPGLERSNSNPPSLLVPALASVQAGAAFLLRGRLERALHRPRLWAAVCALNLSAMTVFCWHQSALVVVSALGAQLGSVPGLTDAPGGGAWVVARLAWFPVLGLMLAAMTIPLRRFEHAQIRMTHTTYPAGGPPAKELRHASVEAVSG
jgi:peptidoglycan/LPS O-acetylase OafA/YrhL